MEAGGSTEGKIEDEMEGCGEKYASEGKLDASLKSGRILCGEAWSPDHTSGAMGLLIRRRSIWCFDPPICAHGLCVICILIMRKDMNSLIRNIICEGISTAYAGSPAVYMDG